MKIYIDKNLTPRYSPNGWPEQPINNLPPSPCGQDYEVLDEMFEDYDKALEKAKADSIELIAPGQFLATTPSLKRDTFIDVEIGEVEVVKQWQRGNGEWINIIDNTPINVYTPIRIIARVKQENEPIPNGVRTITHIDPKALADKWRNMPETDQHGLTPHERIKELEEEVGILFTKLTANRERVKELESALADMITASSTPAGLKAWILEAFKEAWYADGSLDPMPALSKVLDELKIK